MLARLQQKGRNPRCRDANFFVSICQHYQQTAGPISAKFSGKVWSDHGKTWLHFWSIPRNRAMPRCATRGRGLLCFHTTACWRCFCRCSDLNGENRVRLNTQMAHPYGVAVFENYVFWTDWNYKSIHRADKFTGNNATVLLRTLPIQPFDIKVYSPLRQPPSNESN